MVKKGYRIIFLCLIVSFFNFTMCSGGKNVIIRLEKYDKNSAKYKFIVHENTLEVAKVIIKNGEIIVSKGDLPSNIAIKRYDNDKIKAIYTTSFWMRNGAAFSFYRSGKLKVVANYKYGYAEGYTKIYYESGNLLMESKTVDGKQEYHKEYYDNGKLKVESSWGKKTDK